MVGEIIIAVLPSLVSTLTQHFLGRNRDPVDVSNLQDQVARMAADQKALAADAEQAREAVRILVRYLTIAQNDTFLVRAGQLQLTEEMAHQPNRKLAQSIQEFGTTVEKQVRQRQERPQPKMSAPEPTDSSGAKAGHDDELAQALDRFFDGFEEEIQQARLRSEAGPQ